jgi:hypothetical protein
MKITDDQLQNELILINHHLSDMEEGLADGDTDYVQRGIDDVREIITRLNSMLPSQLQGELSRTDDEGNEGESNDENDENIEHTADGEDEPAINEIDSDNEDDISDISDIADRIE